MDTVRPAKTVLRSVHGIVCVLLASASLFILFIFLAFWDEARRSEIGRAFGIYVVRSIQSSRNGVISGESNFWQSGNVPIWVDGTNDPLVVNCDMEILFPPIVEDSLARDVFRSERIFIVGPILFSYFGSGVVTAIYQGQVEEFVEINNDAALEELFSDGGTTKHFVVNLLPTKRPKIERTDETQLYQHTLMGLNISVVSKNCGDFSYSTFRF
jgi:hypothetical protein